MLKILFWLLLFANAAVLALNLSASSDTSGREPERLSKQLNADWIRLRNPDAPRDAVGPNVQPAPPAPAAPTGPAAPSPGATAPAASPPASLPAAAPTPSSLSACFEIGDFTAVDANRFQSRIAPLQLGTKITRRQMREISSYIVFLPSEGSQAATVRKAVELQNLGIADYFIIQEGALQWSISLGIFKNEEAARTHLAMLTRRGVQNARIAARRTPVNRFVFEVRDINSDTQAQIDALRPEFPAQQTRVCTPAEPDPQWIVRQP